MLTFREHGPTSARPVLLLLHFFGGSHREWDRIIALLQDRHRIVAADMPGFGESAQLDGYTVAEMTESIRKLLEYLAPAPVVLVAHSMSGKVAMIVAADPPNNLSGLVLVAPSPLAGEPMTGATRADMRIANTTRERAEKFIQDGFANPPSSEIFKIAVTDVLRSNDAAFHAWPDQGTREDWSDRVRSLKVKTLLVVGEQDKAIAPALQEQQTLPLVTASGGRMHLLQDCAHLVPYEKPKEFAALLAAFAQEVT